MNKKLVGIFYVLLGASSFGILATFLKISTTKYDISVKNLTALQSTIGMMVLWLLYLFTKKTGSRIVENGLKRNGQTFSLMIAGGLVGLSQFTYYLGAERLPASTCAIALMNYTWISIFIEALIFKKKPTKFQKISLLLVLTGTAVSVCSFNGPITKPDPIGILFVCLTALAYGIYIVLTGRLKNELHPFKKSAFLMTGSSIALLILAQPSFLHDDSLFGPLMGWGIFFAAFGTIIPPICFVKGIPMTGVSLATILTSAELPVAIITAAILLSEKINVIQWAGVVIILFACVLSNLPNSKWELND